MKMKRWMKLFVLCSLLLLLLSASAQASETSTGAAASDLQFEVLGREMSLRWTGASGGAYYDVSLSADGGASWVDAGLYSYWPIDLSELPGGTYTKIKIETYPENSDEPIGEYISDDYCLTVTEKTLPPALVTFTPTATAKQYDVSISGLTPDAKYRMYVYALDRPVGEAIGSRADAEGNGFVDRVSAGNLSDRQYLLREISDTAVSDDGKTASFTVSNRGSWMRCDETVLGVGSCGENLTWTLTSGGTLTISGEGEMTDYAFDMASYTYETAPGWADYIHSITSVVIEEGVTSIGSYAFFEQLALESVSIPASLRSVGQLAFAYCRALKEITIPATVDTVGMGAFGFCTAMTTAVIGEGVTSVGKQAFYGCSALREVTLPASMGTVSQAMFRDCTALEKVIIPEGITTIENAAFCDCAALREVTLPDTLRKIGDIAFDSCVSLAEIAVPVGMESIGQNAFYQCDALTKAVVSGSIGKAAFADCDVLQSVTMQSHPERLNANIGEYAFAFCPALTEMTLSDNILDLHYLAFYGCTSLTAFALENGKGTRYSVDESGVLFSANGSAVILCPPALSGAYTVSDSVRMIEEHAFANSVLSEIILHNDIYNICGSAFYNCDNLTKMIIPEEAWLSGKEIFSGCDKLEEVTLGSRKMEGDARIPEKTFQNCVSLKKVVLTTPITEIGAYAFDACVALEEFTIPEGVTTIGDAAFRGTALTKVVIPNSVTMLGQAIFVQCDKLSDVTLGSGMTEIAPHMFNACTALKSVEIPGNITSIALYSFSGSGLEQLTIPGSVTMLGEGAFYTCVGLTEVTVPASVTSMGIGVFAGCTGLTKVTIADGVETLSKVMFRNCTALTDIYFLGDASAVVAADDELASFDAAVTLHYLDGTTGWTDSDAYDEAAGTWNGYKLAVWGKRVEVAKEEKPEILNKASAIISDDDGRITVTGTLEQAEEDVVIYFAVYDEDGRMIGMDSQTIRKNDADRRIDGALNAEDARLLQMFFSKIGSSIPCDKSAQIGLN